MALYPVWLCSASWGEKRASPPKSSSRRRILAVTPPRICRAVLKSTEILSETGRPLLHDDYRSFAQSEVDPRFEDNKIKVRGERAGRTPRHATNHAGHMLLIAEPALYGNLGQRQLR